MFLFGSKQAHKSVACVAWRRLEPALAVLAWWRACTRRSAGFSCFPLNIVSGFDGSGNVDFDVQVTAVSVNFINLLIT